MKIGKLSSLAVAISMALPCYTQAQNGSGIEEIDIEEIVISARKRDEAYVDVPVTVSVFTAQEIESAGIENPSDFIALTPNVTLVQTQNAGNSFVTARGISQNRNSEMSVAVLIDGVLTVNPAQFNQELFDIQQIEVLKGPQGALYGRNAIGGAITITTKAPGDEMEGSIRVGGDSGNGVRLQGAVSGPVGDSDTLKFRASVNYKDTDGFIENTFLNEKADPYKDVSGRLRVLWEPNPNFSADARLYASKLDTQALYYNIVSGTGDTVNDTSLDVRVNNRGVNERDLTNASLKLDYYMDSGTTVTSITSYDTVEELLTGDNWDFLPPAESLWSVFGAPHDTHQSQFLTVEALSQELRFTSPAEERLRWIAGAYVIQTKRFISTGSMVDTGHGVPGVFNRPRGDVPTSNFIPQPAGVISPQITYLADSQDNFAWAFFGELAYDFTDNLEGAFSLRYDKDTRKNTTDTPTAYLPNVPGFPQGFTGEVREETWDDWQPKFTLRYKVDDNLSYYGSLSHGFRSGGFNQTGVGPISATAGFLGVNDTFDAETVDTVEFGIKATFMDGRIRTNTSVYHSIAEGTYFFIFLQENSTQNLGNLKEVEYTGFEFDAVANLTNNFRMNLGIGITDSEITDSDTPDDIGDKAPNVSEYTFNLGGQYHMPIGDNGLEAFVRADYQIIGETAFFDRFQADTNDRDEVNLLDLRIGVEMPDVWSIIAWSKNTLDEEYNAEYSSGGFVFKALPHRWGIDFTRKF